MKLPQMTRISKTDQSKHTKPAIRYILQLHRSRASFYISTTSCQILKLLEVNIGGKKRYLARNVTLISFSSAGTPAMLRSEANDINTNTAATLVCNVKGEAKQINKCITIPTKFMARFCNNFILTPNVMQQYRFGL